MSIKETIKNWIKPKKPDPLKPSHFCNLVQRNGKKCSGTIYENKKLDFQLRGECARPCAFKAEFFAMVYVPSVKAKK